MPEGLSASEVGKEISEHARHADPHERCDRLISITEAVLLSAVALLAAWSGYAAAKWSTESRVEIATASSLRIALTARLLATKPVSAWRLPPPEQKAERQDQDQWQEKNVPARRQEDNDGNRDSDEQELHG
jgi:hypothetical protein